MAATNTMPYDVTPRLAPAARADANASQSARTTAIAQAVDRRTTVRPVMATMDATTTRPPRAHSDDVFVGASPAAPAPRATMPIAPASHPRPRRAMPARLTATAPPTNTTTGTVGHGARTTTSNVNNTGIAACNAHRAATRQPAATIPTTIATAAASTTAPRSYALSDGDDGARPTPDGGPDHARPSHTYGMTNASATV